MDFVERANDAECQYRALSKRLLRVVEEVGRCGSRVEYTLRYTKKYTIYSLARGAKRNAWRLCFFFSVELAAAFFYGFLWHVFSLCPNILHIVIIIIIIVIITIAVVVDGAVSLLLSWCICNRSLAYSSNERKEMTIFSQAAQRII